MYIYETNAIAIYIARNQQIAPSIFLFLSSKKGVDFFLVLLFFFVFVEVVPIKCYSFAHVQKKQNNLNSDKEFEAALRAQGIDMTLAEFMENWCVGMANDGLLIGTQFDQNLFGHEVEPLDLILELTAELKSNGKDLNFKKFNGIVDLEKQIKEITE